MDDLSSKNYISWPILTLMAFVTVIGFDDIMYNFQNQGMTVITSWVLMLFLYVIPYSLDNLAVFLIKKVVVLVHGFVELTENFSVTSLLGLIGLLPYLT